MEWFNLLRRDVVAHLLRGDMAVTDFYNRLYATIALTAVAILVLSFVSDVAGHNWVNIVIIPIWVLAVMWIKFYPKAIVGAIAVTASATGLTISLKDGYEKWDHFTKHAALFGGVFGLTRFLVPIKAYPFMGLLLLGALITLGIYAWVWPTGKAYKRYVLGIVLVAIAIGLFGVITGKTTNNGLSDLTKKIGDFGGYSKTFEIGVKNYADQKICGLPNGAGMRFKIPNPVSVILQNGAQRYLSEDILINDTIQDEEFEVSGKCVTMTLSRILEFKGSPNATIKEPQRFRIKFYQ